MIGMRLLSKSLRRVPPLVWQSRPTIYNSLHLERYSSSSTSSTVSVSRTRRAGTSLSNTSRSFIDGSKLNIINKKYTEDGKLLQLDLTDRAIQRLNELSREEKNPDIALRIGVESGGCHGFQYNLRLSELSEKTDDDCIFEKGGAKVIIDESSLSILRESKIDYTKELIGSMFKVVDSPYTTSSCGCGSSFDFDFSKISN